MSMPQSSDGTPSARLTSADLVWLVCPVCHRSLLLNEINNINGSGKISCTVCKRIYPVVDGLPILLAESATLSA